MLVFTVFVALLSCSATKSIRYQGSTRAQQLKGYVTPWFSIECCLAGKSGRAGTKDSPARYLGVTCTWKTLCVMFLPQVACAASWGSEMVHGEGWCRLVGVDNDDTDAMSLVATCLVAKAGQ